MAIPHDRHTSLYRSSAFSTLEPTPTISSVDDGDFVGAGGGNQTIVITGENF